MTWPQQISVPQLDDLVAASKESIVAVPDGHIRAVILAARGQRYRRCRGTRRRALRCMVGVSHGSASSPSIRLVRRNRGGEASAGDTPSSI